VWLPDFIFDIPGLLDLLSDKIFDEFAALLPVIVDSRFTKTIEAWPVNPNHRSAIRRDRERSFQRRVFPDAKAASAD
jgi:hypothetical protein